MIPAYSPEGSPEFNRWMHETMLRIGAEVQRVLGDNLVALILGGGYGRGEGGMIVKDGRQMPYNDIDFTLVVKSKSKVPWDGLNAISSSFASELTIHVDFSRPLTIYDIEHWPCWLMWYDLLNGHIVINGPSDILTKHAPEIASQSSSRHRRDPTSSKSWGGTSVGLESSSRNRKLPGCRLCAEELL